MSAKFKFVPADLDKAYAAFEATGERVAAWVNTSFPNFRVWLSETRDESKLYYQLELPNSLEFLTAGDCVSIAAVTPSGRVAVAFEGAEREAKVVFSKDFFTQNFKEVK